MGKFKEGDKVRVREWDDMLKEFGGNEVCFSDDMLYPAITYREYMKENFPHDVGHDFIADVYGCPHYKGFRDFSHAGQCGNYCRKCAECWDQYMTEAEYKKYVLKEEDKEEMDYKVGDIVKVVKAEEASIQGGFRK